MKQEYSKPSMEMLGELREVTTASAGGPVFNLVQGVFQQVGGILGGGS